MKRFLTIAFAFYFLFTAMFQPKTIEAASYTTTSTDTIIKETSSKFLMFDYDKNYQRTYYLDLSQHHNKNWREKYSSSDNYYSALRNTFKKYETDIMNGISKNVSKNDYSEYYALSGRLFPSVTIRMELDYANNSKLYGKVSVRFTPYMTKNEDIELRAGIRSVISSLKLNGKSDYYKAKTIMEYMQKTFSYDNSNRSQFERTSYTMWKTKKGICFDWATMYLRLALEAGLPCHYVSSSGPMQNNEIAHAWNIVSIDGKWYHVDALWNLFLLGDQDIVKQPSHRNFTIHEYASSGVKTERTIYKGSTSSTPKKNVQSTSKNTSKKSTPVKNGFLKDSDGKWKYFKNGKVDTSYNNLAKNQYGWYKVTKGVHDKSYTGIAKNQYGWFYVKNGAVNLNHTGLVKRPENGKWYYIEKGKLNWNYTGLAKNQHGWFYVKKGELDRSYTGLAKNQNGWFYVKKGVLDRTYTGVCYNRTDKKYYYVKKGVLDRTFSGTAKDENKRLYKVVKGVATRK